MKKIFKALKYILKFFIFTGLWIPACYLILGFIFKFSGVLDPFDKTDIKSIIYRVGLYISLVVAVFVLLRHLFPSFFGKSKKKKQKSNIERSPKDRNKFKEKKEKVKPLSRKEIKALKKAKNAPYPYDNPGEEPIVPSVYQNTFLQPEPNYVASQEQNKIIYRPTHALPPAPDSYLPASIKREEPKIYMSKLEQDTLIHEYSDCFIVYKMKEGRAVKERIEYKQ